ncbi:MAG: 16S rRNA (cytidine(1402)-2'-O)-methyltransferase [Armatimonadota bacterium]
MASGTLYVVATPIGNLEDLSPRALRILREAAVIAAEDTRVTRKLLSHFDVHTPLTSYHAHSGSARAEALIERLQSGEDVALVSDAGTPGVSDPGGELVRDAAAAGVRVVPIPGPSAVVAALSASGLDPSRFLFEGFLPRGKGDRRKVLERLRALPHTLVFYESAERLVGTLAGLREVLGDRPAAVARELSKKFEEVVRGPLSSLEATFTERAARGECVVVVAGSDGEAPEPPPEVEVDALLEQLLSEGQSVRDAARAAAERTGLARRDLYARAQRIVEGLGSRG